MIHLIIVLAIVGFVVWLITTKIPMNDTIRQVIIVVVVLAVLIWLLGVFGVADVPVPHLRR